MHRPESDEKISVFSLCSNTLFLFGLLSVVFNLALYVIVDPILADWLMDLGVSNEHLGGYFFIYPFTYAITSIFVDHFVLSWMTKRLCIITGFVIYGIGFFLTGPSRFLTIFFSPTPSFMQFGLLIMGCGASLSYVPIFAELIESVKSKYEDWLGELNNTVSGV